MNDLIIPSELEKAFPSMTEGLRKAASIFESIHSFDDVERVFLLGAGLSPRTYRAYLLAVRQFYDFTGGLNPLQVRPADVEAFYDSMVKRGLDRNTCTLRIRGLKKFFSSIRNVIPFYTSPFEIMTEKLQKKLNRTKKGNRTKKALTITEEKRLLAWLEGDTTLKGQGNRAMVMMLLTSGLRASELCQLRWGSLDCVDGIWTANFIGKGDREASQELYSPAVEVARRYFINVHGREPKPEDALFWTVPQFPGDAIRPVVYHTLWQRMVDIGKAAREAGVITRDLQFTPHLFRRSYATTLYKSGMHLKAIQLKTRHASLDTLTTHYIDDSEPASGYLARAFA